MPPTFPCPNPVCTQVFSADAVQGASSLVCPRCGTKFEFRPLAPAPVPAAPKAAPQRPPGQTPRVAASPAKPASRPAGPAPARASAHAPPPLPVPIARPVAGAVRVAPPPLPPKPAAPPPPLAAPVAPMAAPLAAAPTLAFGSPSDVLLKAPRRRRGLPGWLTAAPLVVPVFGAVAGLVLWATYAGFSLWSLPTPGTALSDAQAKGFIQQGNFRINPPGPPWKQDTALQVQMHVDLAYRRTGPSSCMALAFKDYQTRLPRDAELIDDALGKINLFLTNVEYEQKPKGEQKLGGRPALALEFTGEDPEHVLVEGECLTTAYRGFGYWFFTWGPQDDHDNLDGRVGRPPPGIRDGQTAGGLEQGAAQDAHPRRQQAAPINWTMWRTFGRKQELDGYDRRADAVLMGYDPKDKDARRSDLTAVVQVLGLEKAKDLGEAVKEARDATCWRWRRKSRPTPTSTTSPAPRWRWSTDKSLPNADNDADVGASSGHVTKFDVKKSADQQNTSSWPWCQDDRRAGGGVRVRLGAARLLGPGIHAAPWRNCGRRRGSFEASVVSP